MLGGDGWSQERLVGEPVFEGAFFARHWHPQVANGQAGDYILRYEELFGISAEDVAATTYDAVTMLLAAMERAGSTEPEKVRHALYRMEEFIGVTGTIRYEKSGDPVKSVIIVQIKNGKVSFFCEIEP